MYGTRGAFFRAYAKGMAFIFSRNTVTASGPSAYGHEGVVFGDTRDMYSPSLPTAMDYGGVSEADLRSRFGKGYVTIEDNIFSGPTYIATIDATQGIDAVVTNNEATTDHATIDAQMNIRTGLFLPATCRVAGNSITSATTGARVTLTNDAVTPHSSVAIEDNTIGTANVAVPFILGNGGAFPTKFSVSDNSVTVSISSNTVVSTSAGSAADTPKAMISILHTASPAVDDWPGVSVCGNTFLGARIRTDAEIAAVTDTGGKALAELIPIASAAAGCGVVVRERRPFMGIYRYGSRGSPPRLIPCPCC